MTEKPATPSEVEDGDTETTPPGARALTALYADNYYLTYWKGHVRISVGERISGQSYWRSAFVMELHTAKAMVRGLQEIFDELDNDKSQKPAPKDSK